MSGITALFGVVHAEQIMANVCVLVGFFGFAYLLRALNPDVPPWTPFVNFLLNTWFLWVGFYNFHLGLGLSAWVLGYYFRHRTRMTRRTAVVLAVQLTVLFFTHAHPYCLVLMAIGAVEIWTQVIARAEAVERGRIFMIALAILPSLILFATFVIQAPASPRATSQAMWALGEFPMHVFASGRSFIAQQAALRWTVLAYAIFAIVQMRKSEWATPKGALVLCAIASFIFYLVVPDAGLGGGVIKIRFAWAVYMFAVIVAASAVRRPVIAAVMTVYVAVFAAANLANVSRDNVRAASVAITQLASVLQTIPRDAVFVRVNYPHFSTRQRFDFDDIVVEPFMHFDAWAGAKQRAIDLSDYQAATRVFPVVLADRLQRWGTALWSLEGGRDATAQQITRILTDVPVRLDYVVVIGDYNRADRAAVLSWASEHMQLVATDPGSSFVWVFKRR
jgi:hypothetical protein